MKPTPKLDRPAIERRLADIEAELPLLRRDMNTFFSELQDRADALCREVEPSERDEVRGRVQDMVERAGLDR
ncbi:hypothetical protein [Luteimonas kalidii]|uniref:Uncharacterized protein n=1 Tax=Luteimonas kalidii TaxID=3042025 RepID=A0ABT6JVU9_9GAMM|nr:hypothetical protein [Luteimonas kalidii]MDH5834821.1 hypothetical protein [Luteimonas kalidii]